MASPQGSTTDLYTRWVNEELEHPSHASEQKAQHESNLLSLNVARQPFVDMPDSDEESIETEESFQINESDILKIEDFED